MKKFTISIFQFKKQKKKIGIVGGE